MAPSPSEPMFPRQLSLGDLRAVSMLGRSVKGVVFHVVPTMAGRRKGLFAHPWHSRRPRERRCSTRRRGAAVRIGTGRSDAAHHNIVALPTRRLEELRRGVEGNKRTAEARVEEAAAAVRLTEACARKREAAEQGHGRDTENKHAEEVK
uniref:Uncharacterized protein n=1 Tax=Oryza meridionalis TaxID=40149 RepID=A0A0E0D1J0_9ORYZ